MSSQSGINTRDRMDVARCHMMLVNLVGAKKVSIGSVVEIGWADAYRKPVVLVMEKNNVHSHPMILGNVGFVTEDLDTGIAIAIAVLLPTL